MPGDAGCSRRWLHSGRSILPCSRREAALGCSSASLVSGTCGVCGLPYQPASDSRPAGSSWWRGADQEPGAARGSASRPSASPGELAGTAGLPGPQHPSADTPRLSPQLRPTEGAGGRARRRGSQPLWIAAGLHRSIPAENFPAGCLPCRLGAGAGGCRALPVPAPPGWTCRRCPRARLGHGRLCPPPGHRGLLGGAGGLFGGPEGVRPGALPSAASWSHEPLPAALQEAAGPGDPLLLPVCHRDPHPR